MKTKAIQMNGYKAHFYKTDKYTTYHINTFYEIELTRKNLFLCDLLDEYMLETSKNYKTRKELSDKSKELYTIGGGIYNNIVGNKIVVEINFSFFDPKLVQDNYFEEALKFAYERLYNPNFENGKLDKDILNRTKNNMVNYFANKVKNPQNRPYRCFINSILPNSYLTIDIIESKEEYEEILNSFTDKDIIDMYHKIVDESFVGMTIVGNLLNEELNLISKYFNFKNVKQIKTNKKETLKINDKEKYIKISDQDLNESSLYVAYQCNKYKTTKEICAFKAINMILNYASGRLIHKTLRDEMQIIYNANSFIYERAGIFVFNASIDSKNEKKCLEGFKLLLDKLKDEEILKIELEKVRKTMERDTIIFEENKYNIINELNNVKIFKKRSSNVITKTIEELTPQDIIDAINNLEEKVIFFYEGVKNEK